MLHSTLFHHPEVVYFNKPFTNCLVSKDIAQYVYWGNTCKIIGIQITLPANKEESKNLIRLVLSAFTFNYLPVNFVELTENKADKNIISVASKCFIKAEESHFSKLNTLFFTIIKI